MYHNPVQFIGKRLVEKNGVFFYTFNAYVNLAGYGIVIRVVEGYYVGKRRMVEVGFIQFKQIRVVAENIINKTTGFIFLMNDFFYPGFSLRFPWEIKSNFFNKKIDLAFHLRLICVIFLIASENPEFRSQESEF
jgi:hypothetical protein